MVTNTMHSVMVEKCIVTLHEVVLPKVSKESIIKDSERSVKRKW